MNPDDSPDETVHDESVECDFRGHVRRFLSHVTYYQQTGGLHEQVATAPLGGSKHQWPQPTNRKASRSPSRRLSRSRSSCWSRRIFSIRLIPQADAQRASAVDAESKAKAGQSAALKQYEEMRLKIGTRAEEYDQAKEEITTSFKKIDEKLNTLTTDVNNSVAKAVTAGASGPELEETKNKIQQAINSYRGEPNKTYTSSLDRLTDLMENLSLLTTEISKDYLSLRQSLEASTTVAKQQVDVQTKAATDSRADLEAEHKKHEEERGSLLTKVDQLQTDSDKKSTEIASTADQDQAIGGRLHPQERASDLDHPRTP